MTLTQTPLSTSVWNQRADVAQRSLDLLYGARWPQLLHNSHPARDDATFNYWWLAHAIDVRLDGYRRTGDEALLDSARAIARNIRERNEGSLFNDYFDDMLWYALALLRLADAVGPGSEQAGVESDVLALWEHVSTHGRTPIHGDSVSWRRQQPGYKNTPANGPYAILGARLARRTGDRQYLTDALVALNWVRAHLVADDGFVWDGLGREGGEAIDSDWDFTYNQGLYVGACVEAYRCTQEQDWLDQAERTARASVAVFARDGVLAPDGMGPEDGSSGGDTGLFKGVWFRYMADLLIEREVPEVRDLIVSSTETLWQQCTTTAGELALADGAPPVEPDAVVLRPGDDWSAPATARVGFSTLLSAIMAIEVRTQVEGD
ncbi:glycoside hydrolase family 76 protein [Ruania halotolerans]|uniref:glycoside hydrolase family 76 protein n=1 Tax=Ruania halotolerans TaxID=2897773 RepID=UPI001E4EB256|nr:glycoside hydrolase family 76 protein [Ruania halotolerans]UFU06706.1 hypothetical protein LQF10_00915 [Ruania halotolerans]